ncbi:MAG: hypothetical protein AAB388_03665 [Patescibacteria group bacterium]
MLTITSGIIGFLSTSVFAGQIQFLRLKVNLATWVMIAVMNYIGLAMVLAAGNTEPYIQIGWCLGATLVLLAALNNRGDWKWTHVETWSMVACGLAVLVWVMTKSVWALFGYILAAYISVVPQVLQYWKQNRDERKGTAWLWIASSIAIVLAVVGSPLTPEYLIVLIGLLVLNLTMAWLALRRA